MQTYIWKMPPNALAHQVIAICCTNTFSKFIEPDEVKMNMDKVTVGICSHFNHENIRPWFW